MSERSYAGFKFQQELSSGFYGQVYRGANDAGREALIVAVAPQLAACEGFEGALAEAARKLAAVEHPGVIDTREVGRADDGTLVVVEARHGPVTLEGLMREAEPSGGALPAPLAVAIGVRVVEALACAHDAGVTHGAVHPRSVYIGFDGRVSVGDFAVGRALAAVGAHGLDSKRYKGFGGYLAAELALGEQPTPAADVYAAGALLYVALSGSLPPGTINTTPALERVVQRALDSDLSRRYADARALLEDLEEALDDDNWQRADAAELARHVMELSSTANENLDAATEDLLSILGDAEVAMSQPVAPGNAPPDTPRTPEFTARAPLTAPGTVLPGTAAVTETPTPANVPALAADMEDLLAELDGDSLTQVDAPPQERDPISELIRLSPGAGGAVSVTDFDDLSVEPPQHTPLPEPIPAHARADSSGPSFAPRVVTALGTPPASGDPARTRPGVGPAPLGGGPSAPERAGGTAVGFGVVAALESAPAGSLSHEAASLDGTGDSSDAAALAAADALSPEAIAPLSPDAAAALAAGDSLSPDPDAAAALDSLSPDPDAAAALAAVDSLFPDPDADAAVDPLSPDTAALARHRAADSASPDSAAAARAAVDSLSPDSAAARAAVDSLSPDSAAARAAVDSPGPDAATVDSLSPDAAALAPHRAADSISAVEPAPPRPQAAIEMPDPTEAVPPLRKSFGAGKLLWALAIAGGIGAMVWVITTQRGLLDEQDQRAAAQEAANEEALRQFRASQPKSGTIAISSDPAEAAVWMSLGRSPVRSELLSTGAVHQLRIEREGFATVHANVTGKDWRPKSGSDAMEAEISRRLEPGESDAPPYPPEPKSAPGSHDGRGHVRVVTDPPGAQVWLLVGFTPDVELSTEAGLDYEFKLLRDGHLPGFITIAADDWKLGREGSALRRELARDVKLRRAPKRKRGKR